MLPVAERSQSLLPFTSTQLPVATTIDLYLILFTIQCPISVTIVTPIRVLYSSIYEVSLVHCSVL